MTDIQQIDNTITIPAPSYDFGNAVWYDMTDVDRTIRRYGIITGRTLRNDLPGVYEWVYFVDSQVIFKDGKRVIDPSEFIIVAESDLNYWMPDNNHQVKSDFLNRRQDETMIDLWR